MDTIQVNAKSGARFRVLVKNCSNVNITPSDVSSCKYTVYELGDFDSRTPVTGHTDVTVPTSCFLSTAQTDAHSSKTYNFEHLVSATTNPPFPNWNTDYIVAYSMFDTNGEPHVHEIPCRTI